MIGDGTATGMGFEYVPWIPSADKMEKIFPPGNENEPRLFGKRSIREVNWQIRQVM